MIAERSMLPLTDKLDRHSKTIDSDEVLWHGHRQYTQTHQLMPVHY